MAKIDSYRTDKGGHSLQDFTDEVTDLINFGKMAYPVVTAVPAWRAGEGEMAFFNQVTPQTDRRIYVRLYSSWVVFSQIIGSGSGPGTSPGGPNQSIQVNSQGSFYGTGNLTYAIADSAFVINDPVLSLTTLVVGTRATLSIGSGNFGGTPTRVISIGNTGNDPTGVSDSTQLSSRTRVGATTKSGLLITGQVASHWFGDIPCFHSAADPSGTLSLYIGSGSLIGASITGLDGSSSHDSPSQIAFQMDRTTQSTLIFSNNHAADEISAYAQHSEIELGYDRTDRPGYVSFSDRNSINPITVEDPMVVFHTQTLLVNSGTTIARQRQYAMFAPIINALSNATIGSAATLYIDNAPVSMGSMSLLNRYAIWVDDGNVRIDGNLILGGATGVSNDSKVPSVFFTTSSLHVSSNSTTENELIRAIVGTTSLVANTLSEGRTIHLSAMGYYNSPATPGTMIMNVKLGGATILSTSNQTVTASASTLGWNLESLITCQTTGGAGTIFAQGRFDNQSSAIATNRWQMVGSSTVTLNTTGANVIELTCQWGTANAASQLFCTQAVGELLN